MRGYKTTLLKIILFITTWFSSIQAQENVQWYAIDQVEQLAKKQQKKVLIEIYTNWSEGFRQMESNA